MNSTTLSVINEDIEVCISVPYDSMTAEDFVQELVKPLMLSMGYQSETVNEALKINENF